MVFRTLVEVFKMVKRELKVQNFQKGWYMSYFVTTQTSMKPRIILKDNKKTYFDVTKKTSSTDINPPLAINADFILGDDLTLILEDGGASHLLGTPQISSFSTEDGRIVGNSWILNIEDWIDMDYNDIYVALTCWKSRG